VHVRLERPVEQGRSEIEHRFVPVTAATKLGRLTETIGGADDLSLVFVCTKHGAGRLARTLAPSTGRAGRSGTGVTFVRPEQQTDVGKLAGRLGHAASFAASVGRPPAARRRRRRG
jgi:superfamily II DNA/RNA helicase